jgi:hypothetical protein
VGGQGAVGQGAVGHHHHPGAGWPRGVSPTRSQPTAALYATAPPAPPAYATPVKVRRILSGRVASFVGVAPSNWSSGTVNQPSRAIRKEGPDELQLAFYQAANAARTVDPQLAAFYRMLMVERGHCHAQARGDHRQAQHRT